MHACVCVCFPFPRHNIYAVIVDDFHMIWMLCSLAGNGLNEDAIFFACLPMSVLMMLMMLICNGFNVYNNIDVLAPGAEKYIDEPTPNNNITDNTNRPISYKYQ